MKRLIGAVAFLVVFSSALFSATKQSVPKSLVVARYAMVTSYYGNRVADPNVPSDDRQAIADVENAIQQWGKYRLVFRPKNADIIVLVRKGRTAMVTPRVHTGTGVGIDPRNGSGDARIGGGNNSPGVGVGVEAGSSDDIIAVYDALHGIDSTPLWRKTMRNGLVPPDMKLVKEFRRVLEEAANQP